MRKLVGLCAACVLLLPVTLLWPEEHAGPKRRIPPDDLSGEEAKAVELYLDVLPIVVTILTSSQTRFQEGMENQEGVGSEPLVIECNYHEKIGRLLPYPICPRQPALLCLRIH